MSHNSEDENPIETNSRMDTETGIYKDRDSDMDAARDVELEAWAEKLDAVIAGEPVASAYDDDLLRLAARLNTALASFVDMRRGVEMEMERPTAIPLAPLRATTLLKMTARIAPPLRKTLIQRISWTAGWPGRLAKLAFVAALFCILLMVFWSGLLAGLRGGVAQVWHASTSLEQIQGISVTSLERPRNGIKPLPLLPSVLPADTRGASYGVITDTAHPDVLVTFVADYHIDGQDVLLYEQPSAAAFPASGAQEVKIGPLEGQLFQDRTGTNALQWYQHSMLCQVTSKLPVERLVGLAADFQPIKSWELIL
jgi:hypothetical protein